MAKTKNSKVERLLTKMQVSEDRDLAVRRKHLQRGFTRALIHLLPAEMLELEAVIYTAIGRSVVNR